MEPVDYAAVAGNCTSLGRRGTCRCQVERVGQRGGRADIDCTCASKDFGGCIVEHDQIASTVVDVPERGHGDARRRSAARSRCATQIAGEHNSLRSTARVIAEIDCAIGANASRVVAAIHRRGGASSPGYRSIVRRRCGEGDCVASACHVDGLCSGDRGPGRNHAEIDVVPRAVGGDSVGPIGGIGGVAGTVDRDCAPALLELSSVMVSPAPLAMTVSVPEPPSTVRPDGVSGVARVPKVRPPVASGPIEGGQSRLVNRRRSEVLLDGRLRPPRGTPR